MKKVFYLVAITGLLFASCAKTDNPNPNKGKTYSFEIEAEKETDGTDDTRIEMIDGSMYWSAGDWVGMHIYDVETWTAISNTNIMRNVSTEPTKTTKFRNDNASFIWQLKPNKLYNFIAYAPHYRDGSNPFLTTGYSTFNGGRFYITCELPLTRTVRQPSTTSSVSEIHYYMAAIATNVPPPTWTDTYGGEQQWGESLTLTYKHLVSYLRLKLNSNSMYDKSPNNIYHIRQIGIVSGKDNPKLTGTLSVDINTGVLAPEYGTSRLSVLIGGGVGMLRPGDTVYIPIAPGAFPPDATLEFTFKTQVNMQAVKVIPFGNITIERGKIYDISFDI